MFSFSFWDAVLEILKGNFVTSVAQLAKMLPHEMTYKETTPGALKQVIREAIGEARKKCGLPQVGQEPGQSSTEVKCSELIRYRWC